MRNLAQILDVLAELIIRWFPQIWKHFAGIHKMWCHCIRLCLKRILRVIFALCTAESGARATIPRARDDIRTGVARAQSNLHRISWRTRCGIQVKMFNARRSRQSSFTGRCAMPDPATARHRRILVVAPSWPVGSALLIEQKEKFPSKGSYNVASSHLAQVIQKSGHPRRINFQRPALGNLIDRLPRDTDRTLADRSGVHPSLGEMVGARGFEPPTPCTQNRCATRLRHAPTVRPS